jgi:hypothetical protein
MPAIKVSCPHCSTAGQLPAAAAGKIVSCPACKGKFQVKLNASPAQAAQRPAAKNETSHRGEPTPEEEDRSRRWRERADEEDQEERPRDGRKRKWLLPVLIGGGAGLFVLALIGGAVVIYYFQGQGAQSGPAVSTGTTPETNSQVPVAQGKPLIVKHGLFIMDYINNEAAADAKYLNKTVEISDIWFGAVAKDGRGRYFTWLSRWDGGSGLPDSNVKNILFFFAPSEAVKLAQWQGGRGTVRGICGGKARTIRVAGQPDDPQIEMRDCVLVSPSGSPEENAKPQPAPTKPDEGFSTDNGYRAAGWFYNSWSKMQKAKDNEIAAADAKKAFEADLASIEGKRIRWTFSGSSVKKLSETRTRVPNIYFGGPAGKASNYAASFLYVVGVSDEMAPEAYEKLSIESGVEVETNDHVKNITPSRDVTIEATIRKASHRMNKVHPLFIVYVTDPVIVKAVK